MTIGSLLKKYRLEQGKTQAKFVGKIISRSHYAKVENDQHQINVRDDISSISFLLSFFAFSYNYIVTILLKPPPMFFLWSFCWTIYFFIRT